MSAPLVVVEPDQVECPTCEGRGEVYSNARRGEYGLEYDTAKCGACSGLGRVCGELVRVCEDCQGSYWVEVGGCAHRDLCDVCGPVCKQCAREAAANLEVERLMELERLREVATR